MVHNLGIHAIGFQAEVRAIADCSQAFLKENCRVKPVLICFDSQAALEALDGYLFRKR